MIMSSAYGGGEEEACQPITLLGDGVKAFKTCTNFDVQHVLACAAIMFHNFYYFWVRIRLHKPFSFFLWT